MSQPKPPRFTKPHYPPLPGGRSFGHMPVPTQSPTFNPQAFQKSTEQSGIPMILMKPLPCPAVRSVRGGDHPSDCDRCQNGYVYYGHTRFIGIKTEQGTSKEFAQPGSVDYDFSLIQVPPNDLDGKPLNVSFFDKIVLDDPKEEKRFWQRVEASETGIDRLHFPALRVEKCLDASGEYVDGLDFVVNESGWIRWLGRRKPQYDPVAQTGGIYSIAYYIKPSYVVTDIVTDGQTVPVQNPGGPGLPNVMEQLPSVVRVRREFFPQEDAQGRRVGRPEPGPDGL
jgi:hypothetical protein